MNTMMGSTTEEYTVPDFMGMDASVWLTEPVVHVSLKRPYITLQFLAGIMARSACHPAEQMVHQANNYSLARVTASPITFWWYGCRGLVAAGAHIFLYIQSIVNVCAKLGFSMMTPSMDCCHEMLYGLQSIKYSSLQLSSTAGVSTVCLSQASLLHRVQR